MNESPVLSAADTLALLRNSPIDRLIADSIEEMVVRGELLPGERLNEVELAKEFGVSRGPLREAIRLLGTGGLFRQERNRGTFVRTIPLTEAVSIYEVRAGLDATAGRLLCEIITREQLKTLRVMTDQMQNVKADDVTQFHELNLSFHDLLITLTANKVLIETYRKLAKQLTLFRRRNLYSPSAIKNFANEHAQIVDLIEARDGCACANALFAHAQGGKLRMLQDGELAGVTDEQ
jgi:DNA-binding GntR family transcriptional regulator